jgi:hypothetical protein
MIRTRLAPWILVVVGVGVGCKGGGDHGARPTPAADHSPHLEVRSCVLPGGKSSTGHLAGTLGSVDVCWIDAAGSAGIELSATPKGTLTVDGVAQTVPDGGVATVTFDVVPALLRAPVQQAISGSISAPTLAVRLVPPDGGRAIEGTLQLVVGNDAIVRTRALLTAVGTGVGLPRARLGATPPAIVAGSLVMISAAPHVPLRALGKPTTLGQLDLVAVLTDGARHPAPDCGPYEKFGMLPHALVDTTVTVYEASTGKQVDTQRFDHGYDHCADFMVGYLEKLPTVESRPLALIGAYLADLTARRAAL